MKKFADLIVKYRIAILIFFVFLCVFSFWGMSRVRIEYSITTYLPGNTDTKKALDIMDEQFTTYGSATLMIRNISFEDAKQIHDEIEKLDGVKSFEFENTEDYYLKSCALFNITFDGDDEDPSSVEAYNKALKIIGDRDLLISSPLVDTFADDLSRDINFVLVLAIIIIIAVLALTTKSFGEIPAFLLTFGVAALLNMGTNFLLGTISYISNSVCVVLQLALAIDYSIILLQRFDEEKANGNSPKDAMSLAIAKAIPEISGSSLTTISGLLALTAMSLRLGADLGIVLAKSIVVSMITVFFFMPSVVLMFNRLIDRTKHKSFVPKITFVGKTSVKFRYLFIALFVALASVCGYFSFKTEYVYSSWSIDTPRPSSTQIARGEIEEIFGTTNQMAILVPIGDYTLENKVIKTIESYDKTENIIGMSNVEITANGYTHTLTEQINHKDFALFLGTDNDTSSKIYEAFAFFRCPDTKSGLEEIAVFEANKDIYTASLLEICDCAFAHDDFISAYLYDDSETLDSYTDLRTQVTDAEKQLIGDNYTRIIFNINGEIESKETFELIEKMMTDVKSFCPDAIFAGDSMSSYDLDGSFSTDNILISVLTILFVFIVLMFTFRSWGLPLPLVITIQGAIFINFSYYAFSSTNLFFFVYLIVSAIQMGATIDYAIVFTNRFEELKKTYPVKDAAITALNQAFHTILTSGLILCVAGFLIGFVVSEPLISTLGTCLGRGVIISILSVILILPALMVTTGKPLDKTKFKLPENKLKKKAEIKNENKTTDK